MRESEVKLTKTEAQVAARNLALQRSLERGVQEILDHPLIDRAALLAMEAREFDKTEGFWNSQLLRSLSSIAANIAEGLGKSDTQDTLKFFKIARGSAYESAVHSLFSYDRAFHDSVVQLCNDLDQYILKYLLDETPLGVEVESPE